MPVTNSSTKDTFSVHDILRANHDAKNAFAQDMRSPSPLNLDLFRETLRHKVSHCGGMVEAHKTSISSSSLMYNTTVLDSSLATFETASSS